MPQHRANLIALLVLLVVAAPLGWVGYEYAMRREAILDARADAAAEAARREAAARAAAEAKANPPVTRYVPPAPIIIPYY